MSRFWKTSQSGGKYFDHDELYRSLGDGPITPNDEKVIDEAWNYDYDQFIPFYERLDTKEGYDRLHARECYLYHMEEARAGLL